MDLHLINFDMVYRCTCRRLLQQNPVSDKDGTLELRNYSFEIDDIESACVSIRNASKAYMMAELIWYLYGSNDVKFIGKFASMWNRITDDGKTSNSGYGYIIKNRYDFDQMRKVVELLRKDPSSRRAVINLNYANKNVIETKDEPCTIALQFMIRNERLTCTAMMRSNDIWTGLPYDVVYFTTLQKLIADELGVGYGSYTHFATSLHLYEKDIEKVGRLFGTGRKASKFKINHRALVANIETLYNTVDKENILDICRHYNILIEEASDE